MKRYEYKILSGTTEFQLPVFLEASVDEMGIMSGFDGEIEQVEQFCNFTYAGTTWDENVFGLWSSKQTDDLDACSLTGDFDQYIYLQSVYVGFPVVGANFYEDEGQTTLFVGDGVDGFYKIYHFAEDETYWVELDNGEILNVGSCGASDEYQPTPSPTPSVTETPCPVNPTPTPSITPSTSIPPTPSITATPSVTPSVTPSASVC